MHDYTGLATTPDSRATAPNTLVDIAYARAGAMHIVYRCFGAGDTPVLLVNPGLTRSTRCSTNRTCRRDRSSRRSPPGGRVRSPRHRSVRRTQSPDTITIDDWVVDACSVLDATQIGAAHVFASGHGALVAMALAARHADRVRSLTLVNAFARFTRSDDYPHGFDAEGFAAMLASMQSTDPNPGVDASRLSRPSSRRSGIPAGWDTAVACRSPARGGVVTTMTRSTCAHPSDDCARVWYRAPWMPFLDRATVSSRRT